MQYSVVKACLLALAATTTVVAQTAGFNVVTKPVEGEVVAAGETYTIEWIPTLPSRDVSLVVLEGASNITLQLGATIASGVPSSAGKFDWAVPADSSFAVYGIKIQLDSDPNVFQYSNQFKISAKSAATTVQVSEVSTAAASITGAPEGLQTLTAYKTLVQTITSCAPTVVDCPYGKVTSTIIPVIPTFSTIVGHVTVPANCSCTKGQDGKITSTGTAPVHIPVFTYTPGPYGNGTVTHVTPPAPVYTAPAVPEVPKVPEVPSGGAGEVPAPAGTATPQPAGPVFTGAAGNVVVSSLTLVGAAAISLMFL